ncbi:MAG: hypothetical protein OCD02_11345 [Spirochaetaceae bacterium]
MKEIKLLTILLCVFIGTTGLFSEDLSDKILINKVREEPIYSGADRTYGSDLEGEKGFSRYEWVVKQDEDGRKIVRFIGEYNPEIFFGLLNVYDEYNQKPKGYEYYTLGSRISDSSDKVQVSGPDKEFFSRLSESYKYETHYSTECSADLKENPLWTPERNGFNIEEDLTTELYITYFWRFNKYKKFDVNLFSIEEWYLKAKKSNSPTLPYYELLYNEDFKGFIEEFKKGINDIYYIPNPKSSEALYVQDFQYTLNQKGFKDLIKYQIIYPKFNQFPEKSIKVGVRGVDRYQYFYR